ncbi:MAG TPA: DUF3108 domain-containing protein [Pyrinomonadaceae bacterium]|nr:DUF3108 domain-containing protein [Pyrinomonadaceae bacterium]
MLRNPNQRSLVCAVLGLLIFLGGYGTASAQQKNQTELPFARGEQLLYQAELNRGVLRGFDVGELRFSAQLATDKNDERVVNLVGDAVAKGFLIRLTGSKYHIHIESLADAQPFAVMHTKGLYEDKRTTINSEATFDQAAQKVIWTQSERDQKPDAKTLSFSPPVHDVLTLIYFVRTQQLKPGENFEVAMVDNGHTYRCVVNVTPGRKIGTAVGRVNTISVEPAIFDGDRPVRPRGALVIWFTDDARHLPVKAQIKSSLGTIDIKLKRVSYPEADLAQK